MTHILVEDFGEVIDRDAHVTIWRPLLVGRGIGQGGRAFYQLLKLCQCGHNQRRGREGNREGEGARERQRERNKEKERGRGKIRERKREKERKREREKEKSHGNTF